MEKHPHVRGEDAYPHNKVSSYLETPPRAWGRPAVLNHAHLEGGNTPTCVGKTVRHADISLRVEKHPHVRGEDCIRLVPRGGRDRNTPTCVGKTVMGYPMSVAERKHPHVRGEDKPPVSSGKPGAETPPRAWGRQTRSAGRSSPPGNTPTCVGKTLAQCIAEHGVQKHPHVRGEDGRQRMAALCTEETPPRAWGRLVWDLSFLFLQRNTPTCVGKTSACWDGRRTGWKHPHVRGEDTERLFTFFIEPSKQY